MTSPMIVILGPTACGKTRIAALTAAAIGGEIISADSRQVYRGMDIGTGKDLDDYIVDGVAIKSHLVDVADAGEKYSIFDYIRDFDKALADINNRGKVPVVCGGSGMYIETALGLYDLKEVKPNIQLRHELEKLTMHELTEMLIRLRPVHNTTDTTDRERLIRAIEIATAEEQPFDERETTIKTPATSLIFGIDVPREVVRQRITNRLQRRFEEGMIEEVKSLIERGVSVETLQYYGLEYKFITQYLIGELSYNTMVSSLNTAIHQFAKRQMTWFRRMEKRGINIHWLKPESAVEYLTSMNIFNQH